MVRTELKRAFCSPNFWVACGITLVLLAYGSSECLYPSPTAKLAHPDTWWTIPYAWWTVYWHAFWSVLGLFYPIVVMIPYVLSYRRDRDSGYRQLILLKTTRKAYLGAKVLAVACSAFMAMLLPSLCWIPICRLLGVTDPSCDRNINLIHFALSLYNGHPGWYLVMYAVHGAILGAVFAILGLGISAVIKNRYLAVLLPFCYCLFSSSILDSLISDSLAAFDLLPFQIYYYISPYPLGFWTAPVYEAVLTVIGLTLFLGGDLYAGKA